MGYWDNDVYDRNLKHEFDDAGTCKSCGIRTTSYISRFEHMQKAHPLTDKLIGTDTDSISQVMALLEAVVRKTEGTDWSWTP